MSTHAFSKAMCNNRMTETALNKLNGMLDLTSDYLAKNSVLVVQVAR